MMIALHNQWKLVITGLYTPLAKLLALWRPKVCRIFTLLWPKRRQLKSIIFSFQKGNIRRHENESFVQVEQGDVTRITPSTNVPQSIDLDVLVAITRHWLKGPEMSSWWRTGRVECRPNDPIVWCRWLTHKTGHWVGGHQPKRATRPTIIRESHWASRDKDKMTEMREKATPGRNRQTSNAPFLLRKKILSLNKIFLD